MLRWCHISRRRFSALGRHHHDLMLPILVVDSNIHGLVEFPSHVVHPVGVWHAIVHLLEKLRWNSRSLGG